MEAQLRLYVTNAKVRACFPRFLSSVLAVEGFVVDTGQAILSGKKSLALNLDFLFRHNNTDPRVLALLKSQSEGPASSDSRSSVLHHAAIVSHGVMNCGSTIDVFLRDNIHWLAKATNWERFSATASQVVLRLQIVMSGFDEFECEHLLFCVCSGCRSQGQPGLRHEDFGAVLADSRCVWSCLIGCFSDTHSLLLGCSQVLRRRIRRVALCTPWALFLPVRVPQALAKLSATLRMPFRQATTRC